MARSASSTPRWKTRSINSFAGLAYGTLALLWAFALALYIPFVTTLIPEQTPTDPSSPAPVFVAPEVSAIATFFAIICIIVVLGACVYVLAKLPVTIARTGKKVVETSSKAATKAYIRVAHKKDTKKLRKRLEPKMALLLRALLTLAPLLAIYCSQFAPDTALDAEMALFAGVLLADFVVVFFALQAILARLLAVDRTHLL